MDDVIPPPEDLECPETSHTSSSHEDAGETFSDLPDLNFNIEDVDLTNIDLTNLDIDLAIAHVDAITTPPDARPQDYDDDPISFYEPSPLSSLTLFQFKHKCGYCGQPAGWQHNTRHFIQLRSGDRYACFSCLCARWNGRTSPKNHFPTPGIGAPLKKRGRFTTARGVTTFTLVPDAPDHVSSDHHRRLPRRGRRRIQSKKQSESPESRKSTESSGSSSGHETVSV